MYVYANRLRGANPAEMHLELFSSSYFSCRMSGGEFLANDRRDARPQDLDGAQHLVMRKGGDAHLERDARDAAENFIVVKYLFRNRVGVADEQRAGGPARGVELSSSGRRPAAFLADLGERVRIPG
jgi:hypothetical protein